MPFHRVCLYCGSSTGHDERYTAAAKALAAELARRGWELVYGGGSIGLMGVAADVALARGVRVTGVITEELWEKELGHEGLSENIIVASMHERKRTMYELSDGFVVLPGGYGTLDEFFEMLTWLQLRIHDHPIGVLNIGGYYDRLLAFLDHAHREGFVSAANRDLVLPRSEVDSLLDAMADWVRERADGTKPASAEGR